MIRLNCIWLTAVLAYVFFSSRLPSERQCRAIVLRAADGRELTVRSDGSGRYGFGTGMMFKEVRKGTFDFSSLYDQAKRMLAKPLRKAEEPYIALSFWKTGQTAAVEYPVRMDEELLRRIFSLARQNALPWPPDEAMACAARQTGRLLSPMSSPFRTLQPTGTRSGQSTRQSGSCLDHREEAE